MNIKKRVTKFVFLFVKKFYLYYDNIGDSMKIIVFVIIMLFNINTLANQKEKVTLSRCVDGDTARFIINKEERIVRFLAIDTPESVKPNTLVQYMGKDASEYTCDRLKGASTITLEYDENSDKEDKYGRILAFVYVDNSLLEKELILNGYARVAYVYDKYAHIDELKEAENIAKEKKIGIWKEEELLPDIPLDNEEESIWNKIFHFFEGVFNFLLNLFA